MRNYLTDGLEVREKSDMSDISSGEGGHSANNNDLDSYQNKKDSEKKRREQENFYIEELALSQEVGLDPGSAGMDNLNLEN